MTTYYTKHKKTLLTIALSMLVFLYAEKAHAVVSEAVQALMSFREGGGLIGYTLSFILEVIGATLSTSAALLSAILRLPVYNNITVVEQSWGIIRDFANMLFIVGMIVMAFATIFNISGYDWKSMLVRLVVVALLLNFSLVIGGLIIDASQVVSNVFLTAIGNAGERIGGGLDLAKMIKTPEFIDNIQSAEELGRLSSTQKFFNIILLGMVTYSVVTALIFSLVRIPYLWFLLILSPVAWMAMILPSTRDVYRNWWKNFIGWNLFLPIFLFFLYFGLLFLQSQQQILSQIWDTSAGAPDPSIAMFGGVGASFQQIFFYVIVVIFLVGGTNIAYKASVAGGAATMAASIRAKGKAMSWYGFRATGVPGAYEAKKRQIQQEGLPGKMGMFYGGKEGLERQEARVGRLFGVRGSDYKLQKMFVDNADKEFGQLQNDYATEKVTREAIKEQAEKMKASDPRGFAFRKMAAKLGQLDASMFSATLRELSNNPYAADDFVKTAEESKFSNVPGKELAQIMAGEGDYADMSTIGNLLPARKRMANYVKDDPKAASSLTSEQFFTGLGILGGSTTKEGKDFLKEVGKVRPDYAWQFITEMEGEIPEKAKEKITEAYKERYPDRGEPTLKQLEVFHYLNALSNPKKIANMSKGAWAKNAFQKALGEKLTESRDAKGNRNFLNRIDRETRTVQDSYVKYQILDKIPEVTNLREIQGDEESVIEPTA